MEPVDRLLLRSLLVLSLLLLPAGLAAQLELRWLDADPDELLYDVDCGESLCRDLALRNISTEPLTIRSLTPPQAPFRVATNLPFPYTLPAGEQVLISYCFEPTIPGLQDIRNNLIVVVDTNDVANLARDTIVLRGTSRSGAISIEPPSLDIGGNLVGAEACRTITIRNTGNAPIDLSTLRTPSAPFQVRPPLSGTLAPGATVTREVCFTAGSVGRFSDTMIVENGPCRTPVLFPIRGAGMDQAPDIGPILQFYPDILDFDTTRCGTTKCRDITLRNVGISRTVITSADAIPAPFAGAFPPLPIALDPDSSITINICYSPTDAPRIDTALVRFTADSRYSLTIATIFDRSTSMDATLPSSTTTRIVAARNAGQAFLRNLIRDTLRGVVDTAAVYEFGGAGQFNRLEGYSTDAQALENSVPGAVVAVPLGTCIFDALERTIAELATENLPGRRVIVLLTDGDNTSCGGNEALVIAAARAAGIRIYAIGLGNGFDAASLTQMATGTDGRYFAADDEAGLAAIYRTISEDLAKSAAGYLPLRGEGAAPVLIVTPQQLDFDSIRVDSALCLPMRVENIGNAPFEGGPIDGFDPPFSSVTPIVPPLLPGDAVDIEVCFGPRRLRNMEDSLTIDYLGCAPEVLPVDLVGVGYDSVVVEMRDDHIGRPGSIVEIPIHLLDPLPVGYLVDSIRTSVRFNKTMLEATADFVAVEGTAIEGMTGIVESVRFTPDSAYVDLLFTGGTARSDLPEIELARLRFLVLIGNAMETPVEVLTTTFADGNPKVGRRNPATFRIDSICYLPDRLLDGSARYNAAIKRVEFSGGRISVDFEVLLHETHDASTTVTAPLQLALFDRAGRRIAILHRDPAATSGLVTVDAEIGEIPGGEYFLSLSVGDLVRTAIVRGGGE